ncbi:hypothetical protein IGI04_036401 [Brassica rapa subsp. trilocularis]|uniref:Uncharacterized protein n=1 Tax=Brassica rapa subsp. trilocularis TaxID=1813537 RepID=A0ABQ7LEC3_BRACM|nr:hypothetical protein IGI04_036401 [Brassica rapa subsp. trilocularis]
MGVRQHTQDVCVCPSAHTGHLWLSVCVRVCPSTNTGRMWLSISTHISTFVLGLSMLALPVDCLGGFGPHGMSGQYTQDVCGCPPAHTGRPWLSVAVHQHTQDVRGCPCVSVSTHRTSVAVHQYTYQHAGPWTQHAGPSRGLTHGTSMGVRQHTQNIRVCPSAHTGRPWLSVCVRLHTQDVRDCPSVHISARWSLDSARWPFPRTVRVILAHVGCLFSTHRTSVGVRQHTQDVCGCPWLTHRTSMGVRQHTQDVRVCPSAHTGRLWLSVCVRMCPSANTGRMWLSISTHISTFVLGLSMLALPVDCLGGFGPRGMSVQYTQDVCGCPPAHTGRPWLSVAVRQHTQDVRGCPCVSVSTHKTSVVVHQYTYQHAGPWTQHAGPSRGHTHRTFMGVHQHTQNVRGDFGPRGLSVQYTQDVRGCPPAHTGHSWLSVAVRQHTQDVHGCPCVSASTHMMSVAVHQYTYQNTGPWTQHAGLSRGLFGTHRMSVAVHQYTYQHVGPWTQHADPSRGLFG